MPADMADVTDDLKAQGVVQYDVLTGEDMKKVPLHVHRFFMRRGYIDTEELYIMFC